MINWKLRLKNKTTLLSLIACVIAIICVIADELNITLPLSTTALYEIGKYVVLALGLLGIVTDPTTAGIADSVNAMSYDEPNTEVIFNAEEMEKYEQENVLTHEEMETEQVSEEEA